MSETLLRLKRVISFTELKIVKAVIKEIGERSEIELVNSKVADANGVTKSVLVNGIRLLEVAGVVETKSMGMKGTYIKVLDQEALKQVASF